MFVLGVTPSGTNVGATSVSIGTGGAFLTLTVPGLQLGDLILDANRPSNTVNGNTAPATPWVSISNTYISAANTLQLQLSNTSTLAVSTPIEVYIIGVARADTPNSPATLPSGFY
jgi:hypothetical protein